MLPSQLCQREQKSPPEALPLKSAVLTRSPPMGTIRVLPRAMLIVSQFAGLSQPCSNFSSQFCAQGRPK